MVPSGSARSDPACQPWTNAWPVVGGEIAEPRAVDVAVAETDDGGGGGDGGFR
ncbi:hypothetical protein M419DRAFT_10867 [Trichoderma reesei RUT C-30]|uniref:Uncharacterized protein n=1 Tax=Hypocrea jecorina (strain ATCC 56765 / BCRC 32924 / NRRL 11460 / Rut C-30) TaxID=1344414 RepID=A0A024S2E5_HYPJR|nr:hypothetical protein M419DRAFT_10867 [Trichoderma reesei RUT C-30]